MPQITDNRSPDYYIKGRTIEPIRIIDEWGISFELGNAIKYISRAGRKGGTRDKAIDDLEKANVYLGFEEERQQRESFIEQRLVRWKTRRLRKMAPPVEAIQEDWNLLSTLVKAIDAIYNASDYQKPRVYRHMAIRRAYDYIYITIQILIEDKENI